MPSSPVPEEPAVHPDLSIVVPVYRAGPTLVPLHQRLSSTLARLGRSYEILFVEDGSDDDSWERILELADRDPRVQGLQLSRNYGQHNALLCGIRAARGEIIVTLDDDLQNPPEEMGKLLDKLAEGYDVVYGTPAKEQHGLWRDLASKLTKIALQGAMGAETARSVSAYRAFRTALRDAFAAYRGSFVSVDVLLTWGTTRFAAIPVRHDPRAAGTSNYTLRKLIRHAMNMMTGFSIVPLQLASIMGFFFTLFGVGIFVYVLARYFLVGGSPPGFPFLASIIAIFSGAQLFALGIIGEYLARIHFRTMDKPSYALRGTTANPLGRRSPASPHLDHPISS